MKGFCILFAESFNDTILLVLIAAAVVSLVIGMIEHPDVVSINYIYTRAAVRVLIFALLACPRLVVWRRGPVRSLSSGAPRNLLSIGSREVVE